MGERANASVRPARRGRRPWHVWKLFAREPGDSGQQITGHKTMKIAFVNQPFDTILPPYQSSVGACTYGAACCLAKFCEVIVYGLQDLHNGVSTDLVDRGVHFRFFPSSTRDRVLYKIRRKLAKYGLPMAPASSAAWLYPAFGCQVATDLQKQRCDLIHVQHCSQYVPVIRAFNPDTKIVLHLHAEWFSQNDYPTLTRRLRDVDLVTTVSDYVTQKTCRDFPMSADRLATTYNGIDAVEFNRDRDYRATSRREDKRILYVGAVSPHKGIHVLLDAFKMVVQSYPRVRLDIVGPQVTYPLAETFDLADRAAISSVAPWYENDYVSRLKARLSLAPADAGSYMSRLKSQLSADIAAKVAFRGMIPRSELVNLYFDADIFAFPPVWNEGFGIPPVEAMAAGTPVVASRSGGIVETVKDRETGLLVAKNDAPALARALLELLENDITRETMGRAARKRALDYFTWERVAEGMYGRYRALCN
jgi:glycosyltransferase involved in cell wall biosynthesis